jgi:catechol 2,3-dioxygenase-like lactoylglutathione lyase family enzyme
MRIHRLTLLTSDIDGQSRFWAGTLGLPVRGGADRAIEIALQESTIRFEQASPGTDPRYHFAINVPRGRPKQTNELSGPVGSAITIDSIAEAAKRRLSDA